MASVKKSPNFNKSKYIDIHWVIPLPRNIYHIVTCLVQYRIPEKQIQVIFRPCQSCDRPKKSILLDLPGSVPPTDVEGLWNEESFQKRSKSANHYSGAGDTVDG